MIDRIDSQAQIDQNSLKTQLNVAAVVSLSAKLNQGLDDLKETIVTVINSEEKTNHQSNWISISVQNELKPFIDQQFVSSKFGVAHALRLVSRNINHNENAVQVDSIRNSISNLGFNPQTLEATLRYRWIDEIVKSVQSRAKTSIRKISRSEQWDKILTHRWFGPIIFVTVLYFIFQSIFTWATIPMDWIQTGIGWVSAFVLKNMFPGMLRDVLVEGIIGGVGAIVIFLPQILILSFFLTIMELIVC